MKKAQTYVVKTRSGSRRLNLSLFFAVRSEEGSRLANPFSDLFETPSRKDYSERC